MDCFSQASLIQKNLGYLAGEIAFPEDFTGHGLLHFLADMKGIRDRSRMKELIDLLELDPSGKVRKMSKGMKQKLGIINAFMGNPEIVILDEPTSGLDPLMQNRFIDLILEEKKKGTTIFMSSHLFEEVERTCERTAIIRRGQIAAVEDMEGLKKKRSRDYIITLDSKKSADALQLPGYTITGREGASVTVAVKRISPGFYRSCPPVLCGICRSIPSPWKKSSCIIMEVRYKNDFIAAVEKKYVTDLENTAYPSGCHDIIYYGYHLHV